MDPVRSVSGWTFAGQVLSSPVPVVVVFTASPAAARVELFRTLAREYAPRANVATVSIDREPELARCFLSGDGPAVLVFRDGRVADGCPADASPETLRELFARHAGPAPAASSA